MKLSIATYLPLDARPMFSWSYPTQPPGPTVDLLALAKDFESRLIID